MDASQRRQLLYTALARARPGSGSDLHAIREEGASYAAEASAIPDLGPVRFVIVGGLATGRYMPARQTLDTDILVSPSDLAAVEDALQRKGCRKLGPLSVGGSAWRLPGGRILDVRALPADWVEEAIDRAEPDTAGHPFVALPYLVLMKLESGRLQDLADIARMLGFASGERIEATRRLVRQYRPRDVADLESMIRLGKREHEGANPRPSP